MSSHLSSLAFTKVETADGYDPQVTRGAMPALILVAVVLLSSACAKLGSNNKRAETQDSISTSNQNPPTVNPFRYGGSANYFTNPSFETQIAPWQAWGSNSLVEITKGVHKIGRASARISARAGAPYGILDANVVSVPARGDRYVFSIWVRSGDRPKKLSVVLQGSRPGAPALVLARASPTVAPGAWHQITIEGRVKRRHVSGVDAYVLVLSSIGTGDAFFADGASLTRA